MAKKKAPTEYWCCGGHFVKGAPARVAGKFDRIKQCAACTEKSQLRARRQKSLDWQRAHNTRVYRDGRFIPRFNGAI